MKSPFKLEILDPGKADVFLAVAGSNVPWSIVERLDQAAIRVVAPLGDVPPADGRVGRIIQGCAGVILAGGSIASEFRADLPPARLDLASGVGDLGAFCAVVLQDSERIRPYAIFIGRLERDFRHAREAIRTAVEAEAGIPCLWVDDGRHATNVESVREQTRLLIKHATFVIADLTLGTESPERENPSRAHEIGMAIAYERPLLLCSQEPRRYPYYSIGDMQMSFWMAEDELEARVREWIATHRGSLGLRVLNFELSTACIARPVFTCDRARGYVGPNLRGTSLARLLSYLGARWR